MKKAFTLIELIIVVAIVLLMAAFAIPGFSKFGKKGELRSKAEEIKLSIEGVQAKALNPNKGSNGALVKIVESDNTMEINNDVTLSNASTIEGDNISEVASSVGPDIETITSNKYNFECKDNLNVEISDDIYIIFSSLGTIRIVIENSTGVFSDINNMKIVFDECIGVKDIGEERIVIRRDPFQVLTQWCICDSGCSDEANWENI